VSKANFDARLRDWYGSGVAARLQHQLHDIAVPRGTFLIGRGVECQLSLDDPLVSRRHAAIRVDDDDSAVVEDLGSRNGVYLNGVKLERAEPLSDGDLIRIGSQDICYYQALDGDSLNAPRAMRVTMQQIPVSAFDQAIAKSVNEAPDTAPSADLAARVAPVAQPEQAPPKRDAELPPPPSKPSSTRLPATIPMPTIRELHAIDPDEPEETTTIASGPLAAGGRVGGLAIIGSVANKALALGRADEAERILQRSLADVLARARKGPLEQELVEQAVAYAIRLAATTGRGAWVDYVFQLYTALRALMPARVVDELYAAVRKVKHTDKSVLRAYTACLREISGSFGPAERFVQQRIEGLERWAP
jgi:hypothetical protein